MITQTLCLYQYVRSISRQMHRIVDHVPFRNGLSEEADICTVPNMMIFPLIGIPGIKLNWNNQYSMWPNTLRNSWSLFIKLDRAAKRYTYVVKEQLAVHFAIIDLMDMMIILKTWRVQWGRIDKMAQHVWWRWPLEKQILQTKGYWRITDKSALVYRPSVI